MTMSVALTAFSTAFKIIGSMQQARAGSNAARFNEQVNLQNAAIARNNAAENANRSRLETRRRLGAIRAAAGANNVGLEGSPLDILEDQAATGELDALTIQHEGEIEARGFDNSATLNRSRAKNARRAGFTSAGSALLLGTTKAFAGA